MCQIAAKVPCGLSTVVRTSKRFSETNFIADSGRSGRPRKTSLPEDRTVRGRLLEIGLRGCKARPKPLLTEFQRKRRLTWAREHSLWTIKDWEKCLKPTVKYPTKVMVWSFMSSHGVGRLHIASGTVKAMDYIEILQNKLLPTARDILGIQS
ncbi:uncharacterized protein TNCV_2116131 [Trichonephila clavipes]|nr:uncharacterized protein TNCV_2116131 [Trichonephila clavipes]